MPHWDLASTSLTVPDLQDTFHFNACLHEGAGTAELKKVTCKQCRTLTEFPRTPLQAANLLRAKMQERTQEATKSLTFCWVTASCNSCTEHEVGLNDLTYTPEYLAIAKIIGFLQHCAFDHMMGAEPIVRVDYDALPVYSVNMAMGKQAATQAEIAWRERTFSEVV